MQWTNEAPTAIGWYWFRKWPKDEATIVQVRHERRVGLLQGGWHPKFQAQETKGKAMWWGPIPEPPKNEHQTTERIGPNYTTSPDPGVPFDAS